MSTLAVFAIRFLTLLTALTLAYMGVPLWGWTLFVAVTLAAWQSPIWVWAIAAVLAVALNLPSLRRWLISDRLFPSHPSSPDSAQNL